MSSVCVLVTGASGFVGAALVERLASEPDTRVLAAGRRVFPVAAGVEHRLLGDLGEACYAPVQFQDVDVVVHTAARVHVMRDTSLEPLTEYRRVNVEGTLALARAAAAAGVRRFVFLSSIKVNGEESRAGIPFSADDLPAPKDAYGISKLEAESALRSLAEATGMEVVIVRPPLVYGPGVGANFRSLMRWLQRGVPLPLGGISNKRSLVALPNLVDLLAVCIAHPAAANQVFLAGDGVDMSTSELLRRLGLALGCPARLISLPAVCMRVLLLSLGMERIWSRLWGDLQVDIGKTCRLLDWRPPVPVDVALREAAQGFQQDGSC